MAHKLWTELFRGARVAAGIVSGEGEEQFARDVEEAAERLGPRVRKLADKLDPQPDVVETEGEAVDRD